MKSFYEIIESVLVSFLIITLLILFVFRAVAVEGSSMLPTLTEKDRVITTNFFYTPKKGDVVVIDKNNPLKKPLVKRVIATQGDTIKIDYATGEVTVNGKVLAEGYINEPMTTVPDKTLEMTISEGYVFVMGDNRNHSSDSREEDLGQVNVKNILGKAIIRLLPIKHIGVIK